MAAVRPDMRIAHGRSIQAQVTAFGDAFLDPARTTGIKKSVVSIQSWIKNNFSPLVLCFFLSDRDENEEGMYDQEVQDPYGNSHIIPKECNTKINTPRLRRIELIEIARFLLKF